MGSAGSSSRFRTRESASSRASAPRRAVYLDPGRKRRSRRARRVSTWSSAKAFGKGPDSPEGAFPRTTPHRAPACRERDGRRSASVVLIPVERVASRGTDRIGRPSGSTAREPAREVFLPESKPHERDRMKHAGRPRRGVTRQGRVKRRRRTEARVEARDEEPEPHSGRASWAPSSEGTRERSSGPSAGRGELRLDSIHAGTVGGPTDESPWSGLQRGPMAMEQDRIPRDPDAPQRRKAPSAPDEWRVDGRQVRSSYRAGSLGTSPGADPGWTGRTTEVLGPPERSSEGILTGTGPSGSWPGEIARTRRAGPAPVPSASARRTGRSPHLWAPGHRRFPCTAAHRPFDRERSPTGPHEPSSTTTDSSAVGQWTGTRPGQRPAAGESPSGGRPVIAERGRAPTHRGPGSGKWTLQGGSVEGAINLKGGRLRGDRSASTGRRTGKMSTADP
jgi:hypothetical protein